MSGKLLTRVRRLADRAPSAPVTAAQREFVSAIHEAALDLTDGDNRTAILTALMMWGYLELAIRAGCPDAPSAAPADGLSMDGLADTIVDVFIPRVVVQARAMLGGPLRHLLAHYPRTARTVAESRFPSRPARPEDVQLDPAVAARIQAAAAQQGPGRICVPFPEETTGGR